MKLPLKNGDAVFFNPALFHRGGCNLTKDIDRSVNLFQVSSAFGRAMESVDRERISSSIYSSLIEAVSSEGWSERHTENVIASSAEGYAFPTNLDRDLPRGGLAPEDQASILARAVNERWEPEVLNKELKSQLWR